MVATSASVQVQYLNKTLRGEALHNFDNLENPTVKTTNGYLG